jgi:hypothetical protein
MLFKNKKGDIKKDRKKGTGYFFLKKLPVPFFLLRRKE